MIICLSLYFSCALDVFGREQRGRFLKQRPGGGEGRGGGGRSGSSEKGTACEKKLFLFLSFLGCFALPAVVCSPHGVEG